MIWEFSLIVVLLLILGISTYLSDKLFRKLPPGPFPVPFFGNILPLALNPNLRFWEVDKALSKRYGPIYTNYFGRCRCVMISDAKMIHDVLIANGDQWTARTTDFGPHIGGPKGIIFETGTKWRQRRRFAMKALRDFGMGKQAMVEKIHEELGFYLAELECRENKFFNPKLLINNAVANIICSLVFGKRFNYGDQDFVDITTVINTFSSSHPKKNLPFLMFPELASLVTPPEVKLGIELHNFTCKFFLSALKSCERDFDPENIRGFPDLYIALKKCPKPGDQPLDLESFILAMMDMFAAGSETTSTWLAWTLLYMANYPDVQRKCHEAIDDVYEGCSRLPTLEDRPSLVYIDAVANEILRHASIVPGPPFHVNEKPFKIGNYELPAGTSVFIQMAGLHFDSNYWTEPEKFDPERWLDRSTMKLRSHSSHFLPFGVGPRICIGENLARVEWFIFFASMLQRYRIEMAPGYENFRTEDGSEIDIRKSNNGVINCPLDYEIKLLPR